MFAVFSTPSYNAKQCNYSPVIHSIILLYVHAPMFGYTVPVVQQWHSQEHTSQVQRYWLSMPDTYGNIKSVACRIITAVKMTANNSIYQYPVEIEIVCSAWYCTQVARPSNLNMTLALFHIILVVDKLVVLAIQPTIMLIQNSLSIKHKAQRQHKITEQGFLTQHLSAATFGIGKGVYTTKPQEESNTRGALWLP